MASISSSRLTVEEIFKDYSARRSFLAFSKPKICWLIVLIHSNFDAWFSYLFFSDVDELFSLCDPEKEMLFLYGHPDESWEVTLPAEEFPPELPEPAPGINFARDESGFHWSSDCWLLSVAFYFGARFRNERKRAFSLMHLPTVLEVVTGRKPIKDKPTIDSGSKSRCSSKRSTDGRIRSNSDLTDESYGEDDEEYS